MNPPFDHAHDSQEEEIWRLCLFVAGGGAATDRVRTNLERICAEYLHGYEVEVVDIVEEPDLADAHNIVVVPTLLRLSPQPERRVLGDLSLTAKVVAGLGLSASAGG